MSFSRLTIVGLGLGMLFVSAFAANSDPKKTHQLIQQLGSSQYAEREAAARDLEAIGTSALAPLRKAIDHPDAEVRRRALELVKLLEKRAEAELILQPTRLTLSYKDVPVTEVIEDLAKRTGCSVTLQGDVGDRKVSLECADLPFWEVLDRFCEAAALTHPPAKNPPSPSPSAAYQRVRRIQFESGSESQPPESDRRIILVPGKPPALPTSYVGAVRIRAVSAAGSSRKNDDEAGLSLEVLAEPKLAWRGLSAVRVEKAVDNKDQPLAQLPAADPSRSGNEEVVLINNGNGGVVQQRIVMRFDGGLVDPFGLGRAGWIQTPIRLKLPENAGQKAKLLKGLIFAQLQTPIQPNITIDNILQADKKPVKGKGGTQLTIREVAKNESGDVRVHLELVEPINAGQAAVAPGGMQVFKASNSPRRKPNEMQPLTLFDDQGLAYQMARSDSLRMIDNNGVVAVVHRMTFTPSTSDSVPKKLVFASSRLATLEVPFELKDVPLE